MAAEGIPIESRLDIHPGVGIGPIRHGMRPAEALAVFREPQVYEDWMGGNLNDALLFRGLRLHFSKCDSRAPLPDSTLNWVVIHQCPDAYLFGRSVGEWTKESMLAELRARGYDDRGVGGKNSMRFFRKLRKPTLIEWLVAIAILGVVVAIALPEKEPFRIETSSESCHLCGNQRYTFKRYRWYRQVQMSQGIYTEHPIAAGHVHDWWQFDFNYVSWTHRIGGSNSTYRNGKGFWEPPGEIPEPLSPIGK